MDRYPGMSGVPPEGPCIALSPVPLELQVGFFQALTNLHPGFAGLDESAAPLLDELVGDMGEVLKALPLRHPLLQMLVLHSAFVKLLLDNLRQQQLNQGRN